jgi:hypothetical protein
MKTAIILTSICLVVIVSVTGYADVYKWVDEEGRIHYGEKPPVEDAVRIEIRETPEVDDTYQQQGIDQQKLLQIYEEERSLKKEEQLKAEKEKVERKKQCEALAVELNNLKQGGIFYDLDKNGERKYYSESELAAYIEKLQSDYNKHCE